MKKRFNILFLITILACECAAQTLSTFSDNNGLVELSYLKNGQEVHRSVEFSEQTKFTLPIWKEGLLVEKKITGDSKADFHNGESDSLFYFSTQVIGWHAKSWTSVKYRGNLRIVFYLDKRDSLFYNFEYQNGHWAGEYPVPKSDEPVPTITPLSINPNYKPDTADWHVNDHCFIYDNDMWHMFGIISPNPGVKASGPFNYLGHAVSDNLTSANWKTAAPPFYDSLSEGSVLWAPHVVKSNGLYYIFYCAGGKPESFAIALRTSPDLKTWSERKILFREGYQARDPMVLWLEDEKIWVMYYCSTERDHGGHHVVAYRTSSDLKHWIKKQIAYRDIHTGTDYGNTESPFVVKRGKYYYLFTGPRPYDYPTKELPNHLHPGYVGTDVFRSLSFNHFENSDFVVHLPLHAVEVVRDNDLRWYVSSAGEIQGGLFITSLNWNDNE
jgi:arabinan endo-1,5-alpha-L-arabinosidase